MTIPTHLHRLFTLAAATSLALPFGTSCESTGGDSNYSGPRPSVQGSARRPVNNLPRGEYPFDSDGNYVASWAAEGDRRFAALRTSSSSSSSRSSRSSRSSSSSSSRSSYRYHRVSRGDTLWGVSRRYGASVASIKRANGLSSDNIRIGQTLKIPR